jgi:hypothetical protein
VTRDRDRHGAEKALYRGYSGRLGIDGPIRSVGAQAAGRLNRDFSEDGHNLKPEPGDPDTVP